MHKRTPPHPRSPPLSKRRFEFLLVCTVCTDCTERSIHNVCQSIFCLNRQDNMKVCVLKCRFECVSVSSDSDKNDPASWTSPREFKVTKLSEQDPNDKFDRPPLQSPDEVAEALKYKRTNKVTRMEMHEVTLRVR